MRAYKTVISYSYKVHKQKKQYLEDLFIIGDRKIGNRKYGRRGMDFFFLAAVSTGAWESNYTSHTVCIKTVGYRTSTNRIVMKVKLSIDRTVRRVAVFSSSRFISIGLHSLDQHFRFEV